jgi:hypothetical protein
MRTLATYSLRVLHFTEMCKTSFTILYSLINSGTHLQDASLEIGCSPETCSAEYLGTVRFGLTVETTVTVELKKKHIILAISPSAPPRSR